MIFSFGRLALDTDRLELRDGEERVHVEPQVFDLLRHLIEHRHRVVTKQELLEEIWGGAYVSESALTTRIKTARQAVGDTGRAQRVIRTVHGRGYQFVAEVTEWTGSGATTAERSPGTASKGAPTGTVTFLFSDIERSSLLWERHPSSMAEAIPRHDELLRDAIEAHDGIVFATGGDGVAAAFGRAEDAVDAAGVIRAGLDGEAWPPPVELKVRLGLHTGEAMERGGDYLGPAVNRAARIMSAANGGQTLLSDVTAEILDDGGGHDLIDLGVCRIDPAMPPMRLWQLGADRFPPLAGAVASAPPALRTTLIGRDAELEQVVDLSAASRLVSITGPGGAGKTSLALAVANAELASYPSGVAFVELAATHDGPGIARAVAETVGIEGAGTTDVESLTRHLAQRSMLLALDNCEHVLDDCAAFVDQLLDSGAAIHVLTTTREPLGVEGEQVFSLTSLADHAPELFVVRARTAAPALDLDPDDPRVVDVCRRLDGLPLGVELAAAQLHFLGIDELLDRLDEVLDLGAKGRHRGGERHTTLDRTIAWSYDLLDETSQRLLRRLGVFPATFDLRAAEAVGGDPGGAVLTAVSDLVAKHLLVREVDTGRFRLLETIRVFALRRLTEHGELEEARERLRRHVVDEVTARSRLDRWFSGSHAASFRSDLDNARVAFDLSVASGRIGDAIEILVGGAFLWRNTLSCNDGRRWIARLEERADELDPRDLTWLTLARTDLGQGTADHDAMHRSATSAVELARSAGDREALVVAMHFEALPYAVAAPDEARRRLDDAMAIAADLDDPRLVHLLEVFAAVATLSAGDLDGGLDRAEAVGNAVSGDGYEVFLANWSAWTATLVREDAERLRHWTDRQRHYLSRVGLPETWLSMWSMALSSVIEGEDVHDRLLEARLRADREGLQSATDTVLALAMIARHEERAVEAAELLGTVTGRPLNNTAHYVLYRTLRRALELDLGAEELQHVMAAGSARSPEAVLEEHGLSLVP